MRRIGLSYVVVNALFFLLLIVTTAPIAHVAAASAEAPYDWDLEKQYPDEQAWSKGLNEVRERLADFQKLRDTNIDSAEVFAKRLDEVRYLRGNAGHLARFAI